MSHSTAGKIVCSRSLREKRSCFCDHCTTEREFLELRKKQEELENRIKILEEKTNG